MTQEDVSQARRRVVETAAGMLDGTVPFLEGVRTLTSLRHKVAVAHDDEDFMIFVSVDWDTDALPLGEVRKHWATDALERLEPEIQAATLWAKEFASGACESLVARFGS
jgi:hypothetical protein